MLLPLDATGCAAPRPPLGASLSPSCSSTCAGPGSTYDTTQNCQAVKGLMLAATTAGQGMMSHRRWNRVLLFGYKPCITWALCPAQKNVGHCWLTWLLRS